MNKERKREKKVFKLDLRFDTLPSSAEMDPIW